MIHSYVRNPKLKLFKMKKIKLFLIFLVSSLILAAQDKPATEQAQNKDKPDKKSVIFGNIYTDFYYAFNDNLKPKAAFEFSTGLLGFTHKFSDKVQATLIYDVTRTTSNITVTDSASNSLDVTYFEGSKYTAFLKMGAIEWKITDALELSVGQLLNQQYLTVQDKFWGFRYIATTYQERYKYGMPADFGARLTYNFKDQLKYSITISNGEGPFCYQDDGANFLYAGNLEIFPSKNIILKLYIDYETISNTASAGDKMLVSCFTGYKTEKFMLGIEFIAIDNYKFIKAKQVYGFSLYSYYTLNSKLKALVRADYGDLYPELKIKNILMTNNIILSASSMNRKKIFSHL